MTETHGPPDPPDPAPERWTVALPADWPSAWPHLYGPVRDRALFVLTVMVLTTIGLIVAGDPGAQWWAIALPLLLLIGPASKPARARRALCRAVETGRVRTLPGQLVVAERPTTVWLRPATGDPELPLHIGRVEPAMRRYVDSAAVLVWVRRRGPAAVVLPDRAVVYLVRPPGGLRAAAVEAETSDEVGWTLPTR
jgi:hypothetical protein